MRHKTKSKSKKQTKKLIKGRSRKSQRKHSRKQNGGECEYLKVQGMTLPDLKIPDQYALLSEDCQTTSNQAMVNHPNINQ